MKKIIGYILILAMFAGSICGITFGIKYAVLESKTDTSYTEQLESDITGYQTQLSEYVNLVSELRTTISDLEAQIAELEAEAETDDQTIADLQTKVENLNDQILALEKQITGLETSIEYYQEYIETYIDGKEAIVTFYYNETIYYTEVVELGSTVTGITTPESSNFLGWSIDGETIVDLDEYTISESTNFYAVLSLNVTFVVSGETYSEQTVLSNSIVDSVEDPVVEGYTFEGWTIDGENVVDISTYEITKDTTFYSLFGSYVALDFSYAYADEEETEFLGYSIENIEMYDNFFITLLNVCYEFEYNDEYNILLYFSSDGVSKSVFVKKNTYPVTSSSIELYSDVGYTYVEEDLYIYDSSSRLSTTDTFTASISCSFEDGYLVIDSDCVSTNGLVLYDLNYYVKSISGYVISVI